MAVENLEFISRLDSLAFEDVPRSSRYQRSDIFSWLASECICEMLEKDPDNTMAEMRREFEARWRSPGYLAPSLVEQWRRLLNGAVAEIILTLKSDSDIGAHARQIRPVGDLISQNNRKKLLETARRLDKSRR